MNKLILIIKEHKIISILSVTIIIIFILLIPFMFKDNNTVKAQEIVENKQEECICDEEDKELIIDIKGAVKKPGVYKLKVGSIINDAIALAGGLNKNATTDDINLSKAIYNEMVIYISTKTELKEKQASSNVVSTQSNIIKDEANTCIPSNKINLNTASIDEFITLSGVGEAKAQKIIDYRNQNGKFKSIEELKNVSGFGEAAYEKLKDYITI